MCSLRAERMASTQDNREHEREANVLLELHMADPMSEDVLDANSDDVMKALLDGASDIALGPAVALNMHTCTIKLRFDVLGNTDAEIHKRIAKVLTVIERETDLLLTRSSVEAHADGQGDEAATGEFAAA